MRLEVICEPYAGWLICPAVSIAWVPWMFCRKLGLAKSVAPTHKEHRKGSVITWNADGEPGSQGLATVGQVIDAVRPSLCGRSFRRDCFLTCQYFASADLRRQHDAPADARPLVARGAGWMAALSEIAAG